MGRKFGYARISTDDGQDISSQRMKLEELGAVVVFADVGNGSTLQGRDQLESLIRILEPGDEAIALHPDRWARDTADLLTIAKRVVEKKATLRIHDPNIVMDGSDIMGEIMLTVLGMVGMMEKHFIRARQKPPRPRVSTKVGRPRSIRSGSANFISKVWDRPPSPRT